MVAQAQRIVNVMRDTVARSTRNGAQIGYRYGVVSTMVNDGTATVMLAADEIATEGIRMPAGAYLNAGDYVMVAQTSEGDSWIAQVLPYEGSSMLAIDASRARIYTGSGTSLPLNPGADGQILFSGGIAGAVRWDDNYTPEIRVQVKNVSGSTMTPGTVVYISGASGNTPEVVRADADSEATSSKTMGVVTKASISNGATGYITVIGIVKHLNTNSFNAGDNLWLSSTAGEFTNVIPPHPAHQVHVGYVVRKDTHAGEIFVFIQNGFELNELHDVTLGTPSDGQVLSYNASSGYWTNATPSSSGVSYGTVVSETTFGLTQSDGALTSVSRSDHTHGTPSNPVTGHVSDSDPHTQYQKESEKAAANGYASLDASTKVPIAQIPTGSTSTTVSLGDHAHSISYGSVSSETSFGISASDGAATSLARSDHTHGTPTNPVTAHESASDPHTGYVMESASASQTVTAQSASVIPLVAKGATSQTANIFEIQNSAGSASSYFDSLGRLQSTRELRLRGIPSDPGQIRMTYLTNPGVIMRHDGTDFYFLVTANNDPFGNWNSLRPFAFNASTGLVTMQNGLAVSSSLTLGGNSVETQNNKGATNGYASLVSGTVPIAQIPTGTSSTTVSLGNHTHAGTSTLDVESSTITLSNSTVETDFLNFSVAGGTLGTTGSIRLKLWGTITNSTGSNRTLTLKIIYGATTMFADATAAIASNAAARAWRIEANIASNNATNSQTCSGSLFISAPSSATNGTGDLNAADLFNRTFFGTAAEDSTAAKTLKVSWTLGNADTTFSATRRYASAVLE